MTFGYCHLQCRTSCCWSPSASGARHCAREELDLGAILSTYTEARGFPPYDPAMMVALLLYSYSRGIYSSRRIARECEERLDFQRSLP